MQRFSSVYRSQHASGTLAGVVRVAILSGSRADNASAWASLCFACRAACAYCCFVSRCDRISGPMPSAGRLGRKPYGL